MGFDQPPATQEVLYFSYRLRVVVIRAKQFTLCKKQIVVTYKIYK